MTTFSKASKGIHLRQCRADEGPCSLLKPELASMELWRVELIEVIFSLLFLFFIFIVRDYYYY